MAIPKDYVCDGQLNIWDFVTEDSTKPEPEETEEPAKIQEFDINID